MSQAPTELHSRVVIVGAGFGGLTAAKGLANTPLDVTVVDQHNYHLFQPLLYQVATASLSPADIASPICGILRNVDNIRHPSQSVRCRSPAPGSPCRRAPYSIR
jgi:NADH:ubiquinone reductase (H+-translocating)